MVTKPKIMEDTVNETNKEIEKERGGETVVKFIKAQRIKWIEHV